PFPLTFRTGLTFSMGDINGDGRRDLIVTSGPQYWAHIKVLNMKGSLLASFLPTVTTYRGGVDVAASDVNSDGVDEIITGSFSHGDAVLRIFRYNGLTKTFSRIQKYA